MNFEKIKRFEHFFRRKCVRCMTKSTFYFKCSSFFKCTFKNKIIFFYCFARQFYINYSTATKKNYFLNDFVKYNIHIMKSTYIFLKFCRVCVSRRVSYLWQNSSVGWATITYQTFFKWFFWLFLYVWVFTRTYVYSPYIPIYVANYVMS